MKRLILFGFALSLGIQAHAQMSIINDWQRFAKIYAEEAVFFANAEVNASGNRLYIEPKDREKLHTVYQSYAIGERQPFHLGHREGDGTNATPSPLVTERSYEGMTRTIESVKYVECIAENGQPKLCLDKEYISLFKKSAEAHIKAAQLSQKFYEVAVKNLGSAEERKQLLEKKKLAEKEYLEVSSQMEKIKNQAAELSQSQMTYSKLALVTLLILIIVFIGSVPSVAIASILTPILAGTVGFFLYKEKVFETSYKEVTAQAWKIQSKVNEKASAVYVHNRVLEIIATAANERKENPNLKLNP